MKVPFTWKVTGWFMVGWSPEFPVGEVRPLRYFGEDLVAYRDESGELHVLEGHCKHLGAHIGHGGTVVGDCVQCPFHGWRWGPDGTNRYIPYQPDRPNRALTLRVFPVREQYDCVFVWHQPGRQGATVGDARHLPQVPAVRDRSGGLLPRRIRSSPVARSANRCIRRSWRRMPPIVPISSTCTTPRSHPGCWTGRSSSTNGNSPRAGRTPIATIPKIWHCDSTATFSVWVGRSASSRERRTIG